MAWERRLEAWESRLVEKERHLEEPEREARHRPVREPLQQLLAGRTQCDFCYRVCNKDSSCYGLHGQLLHRHHNCRFCREQFKAVGFKGSRKGTA